MKHGKHIQSIASRIEKLGKKHNFQSKSALLNLDLIGKTKAKGCKKHNECEIDDFSYAFQQSKIDEHLVLIEQTLENLQQTQTPVAQKEIWETLEYLLEQSNKYTFFE